MEKKPEYKKIESIEQLKEESKEPADFFILLQNNIRSRKRIYWDGKHFIIHNYIDDTRQKLKPEKLHSPLTNIGKAIDKGAFYKMLEDED